MLIFQQIKEYFNVVLGAKLTAQEKKDLVEFLRAL